MTDRELDELGTSLLAQDRQNKRRQAPDPFVACEEDRPIPVKVKFRKLKPLLNQDSDDAEAADEWTAEQMKRLDDVFRG